MSKAYVIVRRSNDYDMEMRVVYVARTKETAELRKSALEIEETKINAAGAEHHQFRLQVSDENPMTRAPNWDNKDVCGSRTRFYEWQNTVEEPRRAKIAELETRNVRELAIKYGMKDAETIAYIPNDIGDYEILEVEGD